LDRKGIRLQENGENFVTLHGLYSSPSIIRIMKSRRMKWAGHVARMREKRNRIGCWWESQRERDRWEEQDVDGWIILGLYLLGVGWGDVDWIGLAQDRTGGELL
jgi:hypothetical protein